MKEALKALKRLNEAKCGDFDIVLEHDGSGRIRRGREFAAGWSNTDDPEAAALKAIEGLMPKPDPLKYLEIHAKWLKDVGHATFARDLYEAIDALRPRLEAAEKVAGRLDSIRPSITHMTAASADEMLRELAAQLRGEVTHG